MRVDDPAPVVAPAKGEFGTLKYRLFRPVTRPGDTYPLVVCLHGAGGTGTDNRARGIQAYAVLKAPDVQAKHPAFLLVPQKPTALPMWVDWPFGNGSYDLDDVSETPHIKSVRGLIRKVAQENNIGRARVYVTGQSMGGFGTWDIVLRYPEVFAAAIPICGGGSPKHAARLNGMAIWSFRGDEDRAVPVSDSREMATSPGAAPERLLFPHYTPLVMRRCLDGLARTPSCLAGNALRCLPRGRRDPRGRFRSRGG